MGSGSPGRLSLTGSIPIIGRYLGEEPEAVKGRRKLPIYKHRTEILRSIDQNVVMLVTGDPGCGKTTQVPQYILEQYGKSQIPCRILCVLPRRISAQAAAERVRYERGKFYPLTGFFIRRSYLVTLFRIERNGLMLLLRRCDGGKTHRISNTPRKPDQHYVANDLLHHRSVSSHNAGRRWFLRRPHSPDH
jgi:hypothetical protein